MKQFFKGIVKFSIVGCLILLLAGCWPWDKKKKEIDKDDVVLLKIDNNPVVYKKEFYKDLAGMIGGMDPVMLPKATLRKALEDISRFELMVAAARKMGLKKEEEYRKAYKLQKKRLKKGLLARMYEKKIFDQIFIPDSDVKADYEKNKSRYIKEQGGVLVSGVSFDKQEDASSFYHRAKGKKKKEDFDSMARKAGKFKEFGRVDKAAGGFGVPKSVRESANKLSRLPAVDLVKEGKETWVIHVSDRKDPVFFKFEEIKDRIRNQLKVNSFMDIRTKKLEELKEEFTIEINEAFFKEEKKPEVIKEDEEKEDTSAETEA